jgi:hypothetical protein
MPPEVKSSTTIAKIKQPERSGLIIYTLIKTIVPTALTQILQIFLLMQKKSNYKVQQWLFKTTYPKDKTL